MNVDTEYDAIIIGAGPAGASAAILLARRGWRIALVEKQRFPRRKVCGECIAASNLPLLHALGIGKTFSALAGPPLRHIALMVRDRTIRADFPPFAHHAYPWGAALGREYLDSLLLEQAIECGATVYQPWSARAIAGGAGRFHCTIAEVQSKQSEVLAAPVLIDAHGSWEAPTGARREQQPVQSPRDLFAFKANFKRTGLERGWLPVLSFPGGYGGMVVGNHETTTLAFCIRRDMLDFCRKASPKSSAGEAAAAYVAHACAGVRAALSHAEQQGAWLSVGPIRPGIRLRAHGGHAFLIGNAAGEAHPIIGEGISMAIQSAWLLAQKLAPRLKQCASKELQIALQRDYRKAWRNHFVPRIRLAFLFAHAAMRPGLAAGILPLLNRHPGLLTDAVRWSGKIRCAPLATAEENALAEINNQSA